MCERQITCVIQFDKAQSNQKVIWCTMLFAFVISLSLLSSVTQVFIV